MVKLRTLSFICTLTSCVPSLAGVVVRSIDVVSDATISIKPCQLVSVAVSIALDGEYGSKDIDAIGSELAREVYVNGRAFTSRFHGVNEAALFDVDRSSIQSAQNGTTTASAIVIFHWNLDDKAFLFDQPGRYDIKLITGTTIRINVLQPTVEEQKVAQELRQVGLEFSVGLTNPGDVQRTVSLLPRLSRILEKWPDTAYTPLLAPYVGLGKLNQLAGHIADGDNADLDDYLAQRVDIGKRYIVPYVISIHSPSDASAAFVAASDLVDQGRRKGQPTPEVVEGQRQARELFMKIAASPHSGGLREIASKRLEKLPD